MPGSAAGLGVEPGIPASPVPPGTRRPCSATAAGSQSGKHVPRRGREDVCRAPRAQSGEPACVPASRRAAASRVGTSQLQPSPPEGCRAQRLLVAPRPSPFLPGHRQPGPAVRPRRSPRGGCSGSSGAGGRRVRGGRTLGHLEQPGCHSSGSRARAGPSPRGPPEARHLPAGTRARQPRGGPLHQPGNARQSRDRPSEVAGEGLDLRRVGGRGAGWSPRLTPKPRPALLVQQQHRPPWGVPRPDPPPHPHGVLCRGEGGPRNQQKDKSEGVVMAVGGPREGREARGTAGDGETEGGRWRQRGRRCTGRSASPGL